VGNEGPRGWGLDVRLTTMFRKRITLPKPKELQTGCNVAEPSEECCGSKILSRMMMIEHENSFSISIFYDK
jgi:hypothetical protein